MGNCRSCDSIQVPTVKLILQDGRLQEFSHPVKASYLLEKNPSCFICNSDEMEFDDVVSAVSEDEDLQPGQLYFSLPLSRLKYPLQADEMAALAVQASSALMKSNAAAAGDKFGCCRKQMAVSADVHFESYQATGRVRREAHRRKSSGGGRNFTAKLSAIPE